MDVEFNVADFVLAGPVKPRDVQVLSDEDRTFLAWMPVENAQSYTVKVRRGFKQT